MRPLALSTLAAAALLAGCAGNPIVPIAAPGFGLAQSGLSGTDETALNLQQARRLLMHVRATYRERIATQLGNGENLQSALVVVGAAVAGLAAAKVHRDAILGLSLVGGTAYAVGNLSLDQRRLLAWDAGIKALDCADEAVIPIDLDASTRGELIRTSQALGFARTAVKARIDWVQRLAADVSISDQAATLAGAAKTVAAANAALAEAEKSRQAADRLGSESREAGQRLAAVVRGVDGKVTGVILQTVRDLSSVNQVIAGLGGFASAFAPGAELDKTFSGALAQYKAKSGVATAHAGNSVAAAALAALENAIGELDIAVSAMGDASAAVNTLLNTVDGGKVTQALKACNVGDVVVPLSVEPATLDLEAKTPAAAKGVAIAGGTKPYSVRLLDGPVDGLNLLFGGGFADMAQVSAAAGVPADTYRVQISDASATRLSKLLVVTVAGKPAATDGQTPKKSDAPGSMTLDELSKTLSDLGNASKAVGQANKVTVLTGSAKVNGVQVEITVTCTPPSPQPKVNAAALATLLLADAKATDAFKDRPNPIVFKGSEACVAKP